ncbi:hypothetical protein HanIR_Chr09g0405231 [Helianthus annuus]|nr:hypothetical protein HanIR_Chr09g0405231 [Helianthus annuus]
MIACTKQPIFSYSFGIRVGWDYFQDQQFQQTSYHWINTMKYSTSHLTLSAFETTDSTKH